MNTEDLCLCARPEPSGDDAAVYCTDCNCQLVCPVCGMQYYDTTTFTAMGDQLSSVASNHVFAECMAITRGPNDTGSWQVVEFGHTPEQARSTPFEPE